ncbi:MAG: DUF5916 domain-containing protein [Myxococcota bacterium]|nr:DUF5916 domain-containing protein [Myxococcota bacterium]
MRCPRPTPLALLACALAAAGAARASGRPQIHCTLAAADDMALDGRLDEPAWQAAEFSEAFTQKAPDEGAMPTQRTRFAVLRTERALHFGFECLDAEPEAIVALTARRDRQVESDWVAVDVDSRGDGSSAFHFRVNAAGAMVDGVRGAGGDVATEWDGVWDAAVRRDERGWHAEIEIPLSTLRFSRRPGLEFALQARRGISRRHEIAEWAFSPRSAGGEIVHYGRLGGLDDLPTPWPLDLAPYEARGFAYRSSPDPGTLAHGWEPIWNLGLDATLRLGTSLALDAAINPEFGQVEVDEVVLNLTTIETRFPEKRPFFLAGRELFTTPLPIFYTRRIGAAPDAPAAPPGWTPARSPEPTRIWAALKLTGEFAPRWTIAAIDTLTAGQEIESFGPRGEEADRVAEPPSHFGILRLVRNFGGDNSVGVMATAVNRIEPDSYAGSLCPSGRSPRDGRCFHDAYVGAVDGSFRTADGSWSGSAQAAVSGLVGGPSRMLPDGTWLDAGDVGWAAKLVLSKPGGNWRGNVHTAVVGREFWPNDAGYIQRGNIWRLDGSLSWWTADVPPPLHELQTELGVEERVSLAGRDLGQVYGLVQHVTFRDLSKLSVGAGYKLPRWDDRELRDGAVLERAGSWVVGAGLRTDTRRAVTLGLEGILQGLDNGWNVEAKAMLGFKPLSMLTLDLEPTATWTEGEPRRVGVAETVAARRYLLGDLEASSVGATARASWAFTPRLTLQAYGQVFLSAGRYGPFRAYETEPGSRPAIALDDLAAADPPASRPDFSRATMNASVVLRWEYLPGSVLHLVYTHSERPADGPDGGTLDLGSLGAGGSTDGLLLKVSYLWN